MITGRKLTRDPIYSQLNELLREVLHSGEFRRGEQFLTERKIAERFGVSRVTANKALSHLVTSGLVEFRPGIGTFVKEPALALDLGRLVSFTARAEAAGRRPETRVLTFQRLRRGEIPPDVGLALAMGPREDAWFFERLRLADGVPVIWERRHLLVRLCPRLTAAKLTGSLYRLLTEAYGLRIVGADQTIRAVSLSAAIARLLAVPTGAAALQVHARGDGPEGPLWVEDTFYRGDQYEFQNPLSDGRPLGPGRMQAQVARKA